MNLGRAIGGFSSILIGFLIDHYSLTAVMLFLTIIYLISLSVVLLLPGMRQLQKAKTSTLA